MSIEELFCGDVDPGDRYDKMKWDFNEKKGYTTIYIEDYPYKVIKKGSREDQEEIASKLYIVRQLINDLSDCISRHRNEFPKNMQNMIDIFLDIHQEKKFERDVDLPPIFKKREKSTYPTHSNFLLSQIPSSTGFMGLNKPKNRYLTDQPNVGPDKNIRAEYRDIFLNINKDTKYDYIISLLIHELSHTMANHVRWRPDDHGKDFTSCEKLLKKMYKKCVGGNVKNLDSF